MENITSKENSKIKLLKKLNQKKYRDKYGKFLVENLITIHDGLKSGRKIEELFITKDLASNNSDRINYIISNTENIYLIDEKTNKSFSSLDTPSGICAVYKKIENEIDYSNLVVYLNNINDPGNLGTLLRSALAFDIKNVVVDANCADVYNPKVINASKDAIFKLNIVNDNKRISVLKSIKEKLKIYSTRLQGGNNINNIDKKNVICLILGNESHGVSEEILNLSDSFIEIPMSNRIESLNVGVAGSILFYEIYKNSI